MQVISTNVASLNTQRQFDRSAGILQASLQRLSSGLRINSAKDDAAGLAISERMTGQVRGMEQARRNANDGVSIAQTGEGALTQMSGIMQRIRELAVQSANATNSASDRAALNSEVGQLTAELQRFALSTEFNGQALFDGNFGTASYQVGANANQTISTSSGNFQTNQYGTRQLGASNKSTATTGAAAAIPAAATAAQIAAAAAAADVLLTAPVQAAWAATATALGLTGAAAETAWGTAATAWAAAGIGGSRTSAANSAVFAWQNMGNQANWQSGWGSAVMSLFVAPLSALDGAALVNVQAAASDYKLLTGTTFAGASGAAVAAAGTLTLSSGSGTGTYAAGMNDSAGDLAAGINAMGVDGVKASARTETGLSFGAGSGALNLYVSSQGKNGTVGTEQAISFSLTSATDRTSLSQAVTAFNNVSKKTGITARLNDTGTGLLLTAEDGSNIQLRKAAASDSPVDLVMGTTGSTATLAAASTGTNLAGGQVTMNSSRNFSLQTDATLSLQAGVLGDAVIAVSSNTVSGLKSVSDLDVSSVSNATQALRIADDALTSLQGQRAIFGALQNRLEYTISNLQTASENLSSARSRIRDADFASETASLTRAQVLQQAGTAMLAQANALPQQVLSLLRG